MKDKIKIGVIGLGQRGGGVAMPEEQGGLMDRAGGYIDLYLEMKDVEILGVCDEYEDRALDAVRMVKAKTGKDIKWSTDYRDIIAIEEIDAIMVITAWEMHVPIACAAMKAGKYVGVEVGGAYSVEDCWRLVRTSEETGMPCMLLENCCYGRPELAVLNMVKKGLFGEIVHCSGGYFHDLRDEILNGNENRHYRLRNYMNRNCDNYPTHQLGPICKILNINRGNRILTLSSVASKAAGLKQYALDKRGADSELYKTDYTQGDIVTTILKCAHGETIVLQLDTTLPRPFYSRNFSVRGTKGMYNEDTASIVIDGINAPENAMKRICDNLEEFYEKYDHPLWNEYARAGIALGHGGIDWLVTRAFFESVKNGTQTPITVYDAATWMSIGALSESSIARGGMPVDVPDFTGGKWIKQDPILESKYCLDKVCEDDSVSIY